MKKTSLILIFSATIINMGTTYPMLAWLARGARTITGRVPVRTLVQATHKEATNPIKSAAEKVVKSTAETTGKSTVEQTSWQSARARAAAARKFVATHKRKMALVGLTGTTAATAGAGWILGLDEAQRETARRNLAEIARRAALSVQILRGEGLPEPVVVTADPEVVRVTVDPYVDARGKKVSRAQALRDCGLDVSRDVSAEQQKLCVEQHRGFAAAAEAAINRTVEKRSTHLKELLEQSKKEKEQISAWKKRNGIFFTADTPTPNVYTGGSYELPKNFVTTQEWDAQMIARGQLVRAYHMSAVDALDE